MKKVLSTLLAFAIIICAIPFTNLSVTVNAETSGIYTYKLSDDKVTIIDVDNSVSGDIIIPDTLGGFVVNSIGDMAFGGCNSLTGITIPDSITTIGYKAFYNCAGIANIIIPDSVTDIGSNAFYGTAYYNDDSNWQDDALYIGNHLIQAKNTILGDYTIKYGTKTIADEAFYDCYDLTNIIIPDSVVTIGKWAFEYCSGLTNVTIPNSVTSIGWSTFYCCDSLKSIIIPVSVTSIGGGAFYGCYSLTDITIPKGVTSIGWAAFWGCSSLTDITVPDGVTIIEECTFYDCSSLTSIIIPDSVTGIGYGAFSGCSGLTDITMPDSVLLIDDEAFLNCYAFKNVFYKGSEQQKASITIGFRNSELTNATWYYNSCIGSAEHSYSDGICSVCGFKTVKSGDVNGDNNINGKDYAILLQYINGWSVTVDIAAADVTADGNINGKDYALLLQYINGWDVELK